MIEEVLQNDVIGIDAGTFQSFLAAFPHKLALFGIRVVLAIVLFWLGAALIKLLRKILRKGMQRAKVDQTAIRFVDSFSKIALYVILIFVIASSFGLDAAGIVALLGSAGVAIGLAVQGSLSNLAGGVLLLILRPFVVGDYILTDSGHEGVVDEIQIFYTKLRTPDNKVIVLPNGNLSNHSIVNATASKMRRLDLFVGISYQSDVRKAKEALLTMLERDKDVLKDQEKVVYVEELADSCVKLGIRCWLPTPDYISGKWRLTERLKEVLEESEIEIPFPQIDVHIKEDIGNKQ
ncbi:MAG: mechanosensitive ion channel family protein [Lachnospiraceae bacterium]|jgi:small conductance mechanosensitive channel|nr:mechanosensitive ion channel family protein [Lachnospiraceae bacterium]